MTMPRHSSPFAILTLAVLMTAASAPALADEPVFTAVAKHLKERYHAKERHVPFIGLAGFAVKLVRPAGVKSIKLKIFENLSLHEEGTDNELNTVLRNSLSAEWQPLVRVFSRNSSEQTFVYARGEGKNVRLVVVAIEQEEATLLNVKVDPDALVKWLDHPKLLGISLGGPMR